MKHAKAYLNTLKNKWYVVIFDSCALAAEDVRFANLPHFENVQYAFTLTVPSVHAVGKPNANISRMIECKNQDDAEFLVAAHYYSQVKNTLDWAAGESTFFGTSVIEAETYEVLNEALERLK